MIKLLERFLLDVPTGIAAIILWLLLICVALAINTVVVYYIGLLVINVFKLTFAWQWIHAFVVALILLLI